METNDAQPAASSPAPSTSAPVAAPAPAESTSAPRTLESLSPSQRDHWRLTGDFPGDADPSPSPAESAPAPPAEQAASTDATPPAASEPAKPTGAEKRKTELATEIQDLLRQRALLRAEVAQPAVPQTPAQDAQPGSSPAVSGAEFPDFDVWAENPANRGKSYEKYTREQVRHEIRQEEAARQVAAQRHERVAAFQGRVNDAAKADPEFFKALRPEVLNLRPVDDLGPGERPSALNVMAQEIVQSAHAGRLMRHFSDHPEEFAALARAHDFASVVRHIGRLEARFDTPAPSVPAVTTAPEPPVTLGSKTSLAADEVEGALQRGDVAAYIRAQNAREMAQVRR